MNFTPVEKLLLKFIPESPMQWSEAKRLLIEIAAVDENLKMAALNLAHANISDATVWEEVGRILNIVKKYIESQKAYYNAFRPGSENKNVLNALVYTFRQAGLDEQAIELYSARLQEDVGDLSALEKLGNLYFKAGKYEEASNFYGKFLSLRPTDETKLRLLNTSKELIAKALVNIGAFNVGGAELQEVKAYLTDSSKVSENSEDGLKGIGLATTLAARILCVLDSSESAYENAGKHIKEIYEAMEFFGEKSKFKGEGLASSNYLEMALKGNSFSVVVPPYARFLEGILIQQYALNFLKSAKDIALSGNEKMLLAIQSLEGSEESRRLEVNYETFFASHLTSLMVSEMEHFFGNAVSAALRLHPKKMGSHTFTLSEILSSTSEELIARAASTVLNEIMYKKPLEYLKSLTDLLSIDSKVIEHLWPSYVELKARRDIGVHGNWIVNEIYIRKLREAKLTISCSEGDRLIPDFHYLEKSMRLCADIAKLMSGSLGAKWIKSENLQEGEV